MPRTLLCLLALLLLRMAVSAQELPKVTEEGRKALDQLLRKCVEEGGLKVVEDPRSKVKANVHVLADWTKLRGTVHRQRELLTPALRDALIARWQEPGLLMLLYAVSEETLDDRAWGFAWFFVA